MPRRARRDIFADAKVILCRWHSDIIFAVYTREANITRQRRISLHSNTSRRKANITEKAIVKCNRFFMARPKGFCLGTAVPIASLRSLPRLKNSPPDCFFTPCSNPFGLVEQKNKAAFYDATLSLWPARRDSNPHSSESESAALSSCATGGYKRTAVPSFIFIFQSHWGYFSANARCPRTFLQCRISLSSREHF